eukprot:7317470-Prymnesium_polylepis.1
MRREPGLERGTMPVRLLRTVVDTARNTHLSLARLARVPRSRPSSSYPLTHTRGPAVSVARPRRVPRP